MSKIEDVEFLPSKQRAVPMTLATSPPITTTNQHFVLPGRHSWEDFKAIQAVMKSHGLRITYLGGVIEFMTLGEYHESIKTLIGFLIE